MSHGRASSGRAEMASDWPSMATPAASTQIARPARVIKLVARRAWVGSHQVCVFDEDAGEQGAAGALVDDDPAATWIGTLDRCHAPVEIARAVFDKKRDALARRAWRQWQVEGHERAVR